MDIKKLLKYDVKQIDFSKLTDFASIQEKMLERPNLVLNVLIIFITLIIAFNILVGKKDDTTKLRKQVSDLKEKNAVLEKFQKHRQELDEYVRDLPKGLPADQMVSFVSDLALSHNLSILAFSPVQHEKRELYDQAKIKVELLADEYKNLGFFVSEIEQSGKALKIESWKGSLNKSSGGHRARGSTPENNQSVYTQMEITSFHFHK